MKYLKIPSSLAFCQNGLIGLKDTKIYKRVNLKFCQTPQEEEWALCLWDKDFPLQVWVIRKITSFLVWANMQNLMCSLGILSPFSTKYTAISTWNGRNLISFHPLIDTFIFCSMVFCNFESPSCVILFIPSLHIKIGTATLVTRIATSNSKLFILKQVMTWTAMFLMTMK